MWSPNGKQIAFHSSRPLVPEVPSIVQIYVMNADGSDQTLLSDRGTINFGPDWSFHRPAALRP